MLGMRLTGPQAFLALDGVAYAKDLLHWMATLEKMRRVAPELHKCYEAEPALWSGEALEILHGQYSSSQNRGFNVPFILRRRGWRVQKPLIRICLGVRHVLRCACHSRAPPARSVTHSLPVVASARAAPSATQ